MNQQKVERISCGQVWNRMDWTRGSGSWDPRRLPQGIHQPLLQEHPKAHRQVKKDNIKSQSVYDVIIYTHLHQWNQWRITQVEPRRKYFLGAVKLTSSWLCWDQYCRIPIRHFFSQSRRLLTKNFWKCNNCKWEMQMLWIRGQGAIKRGCYARYQPFPPS